MQKFMKTCWMALALCAFSAYGADAERRFYLKPGAADLAVASSYTTDSGYQSDATVVPGTQDNDIVFLPAGTVSIDAVSESFTTLSGVRRVRPLAGSVLEITVAENDTKTFNAPINWFFWYRDGSFHATSRRVSHLFKAI